MSISCQLDLFDKPILLYVCDVWGYGNNDILERVHLKFCKLLLRVKSSTPSCMIYGELGKYPVELDIKLRMVSYWARLLTYKESKLSSVLYKLLLHFSNGSNLNSPWLKYIENIFNECGLSYIWRDQYFLNVTWLKLLVKTCLQDQFKQTWYSNIQNRCKTLNYRLFKDNFCFEKYFDILDNRDIFTFCRFRTTNHKLPIEYGRWGNIQRNARICPICNSNDIGDEFHYILQCKSLSAQREVCIDKKYLRKFKDIISMTKKSKLRKLCSFIRNINSNVRPLG